MNWNLYEKNITKNINNNLINNSYKENKNDKKENVVLDNNEDDINKKQNLEENIEDKISDSQNLENILSIERNNINPVNNKNNNVFEFQNEKISSQFEKFFTPGKEQSIKKLVLINNTKNNYSLDNSINQNSYNNKENNNYLSEIKQNIKKKMYLLRSVQRQSHKFVLKEKINNKKIQLKLNKYISKYNYCDLASIFSKNPSKKYSILDKYLKKSDDNVLDPALKDINNQINYNKRLISILPNIGKTINNTEINQNHYSKIKNISIDNNINHINKKIKSKLILLDNDENTINNSNNTNKKANNNFNDNYNKKLKDSLIFKPNDSKLKYIKLNYNNLSLDLENIKNSNNNLNNNNIKTLSNEFYNEYFANELNKKHKINTINEPENENKKIDNIISYYQKLDNYKINKMQLMNNKKEREIKKNQFSQKYYLSQNNSNKKGISLVDPLLLDKFNQKYGKERLNVDN